ncbi:hypothetical protein IL38_24050 [Actinopolyspora erythraea]|uniref:Uncharacterized protein n=1 Tax=Actinopolyspora erythraea TaxID=414996 RepID=A0ABR4WYG6_9ACTN|nr:hypothetical protein [Actinopolyspora erythraea]KGI79373.1 hypothetical protein IL38_24050 [Actinopolyspora erythraea]
MTTIAMTVTTIDIRNIGARLREEFALRDENHDLPTGRAVEYFAPAHRVTVTFLRDGAPTNLERDEEVFAALRTIEPTVNAALRERAGADVTGEPWVFSPYAGCDCPCSPGFLVPGRGEQYQASVTVELH